METLFEEIVKKLKWIGRFMEVELNYDEVKNNNGIICLENIIIDLKLGFFAFLFFGNLKLTWIKCYRFSIKIREIVDIY